jgi:hypothetical protein
MRLQKKSKGLATLLSLSQWDVKQIGYKFCSLYKMKLSFFLSVELYYCMLNKLFDINNLTINKSNHNVKLEKEVKELKENEEQ